MFNNAYLSLPVTKVLEIRLSLGAALQLGEELLSKPKSSPSRDKRKKDAHKKTND